MSAYAGYRLLVDWKKITPDFPLDDALKGAADKDAGWMRRAIERLQQNIRNAMEEAA